MSAGKIDQLLYLWGSSLAAHRDTPPFADHQDLYNMIGATPIGDAPWKSFRLEYNGDQPLENVPSWMDKMYDVWYRDPQVVIKNIFANTDFDGEIDYTPYCEFAADGSQRFKDFMSGEWAWDQAVHNSIPPCHHLSGLLLSFYNGIVVFTPYMIVNITNRKINRPVVILACSNRYHCFVATQYNGYECCTISLRILHNFILLVGFLPIPKGMLTLGSLYLIH